MLRILSVVSVLVFFVTFLSGCDLVEQKKPAPPAPQVSAPPNEPEAKVSENNVVAESIDPAPPKEVRVTADVGVGKKGHYGRMSIFSHTIGSYYRMQERISFDLIVHDLNIYKAMNGSAPKTYDEFMEKIIKANPSIKLPELKEGCHYDYDPEKEELVVVYPIE